MPKSEAVRERLSATGRPVGVDRKARMLRGYVVAQKGAFKSGRGEFDDQSLAQIVEMINARPRGVKSHFAHPTMSDDGIGSLLGRCAGAYLDGDRVRANLAFSAAASTGPKGDLAGYVMDLAEEDPDALSSSLVITPNKLRRLDDKGRPLLDAEGEELPPLWRPKSIDASDIVDTGDACDGLLSAGIDLADLRLGSIWQGAALLDRVFGGHPREVVERQLAGWVAEYLAHRYGGADELPRLARRLRLAEIEAGRWS